MIVLELVFAQHVDQLRSLVEQLLDLGYGKHLGGHRSTLRGPYFSLRLWGRAGWRPGSASSHSIVLRIVLDLGQSHRLHDRWDVHAEAAAQALLQPVPAANRILRRPRPGLDGSVGYRFLLVGAAERHPVTVLLEHLVQVVQPAQLIADLGLAHLDDKGWRGKRFVPGGPETRRARGGV